LHVPENVPLISLNPCIEKACIVISASCFAIPEPEFPSKLATSLLVGTPAPPGPPEIKDQQNPLVATWSGLQSGSFKTRYLSVADAPPTNHDSIWPISALTHPMRSGPAFD